MMDVKRERLAWPDIAKAACIIAVVLFHVVRQHVVTLPWGPSVPIARLWIDVNAVLQPIRMPLFFAISGLMASSALQRSWRATGTKRVLQPFYLYLVWGLVFLFFFSVGPQLETGYANLGMATRVSLFLYGVNMAWYLWALGVFFVAARLTRSWPLGLVLGAAALLCYASKTAYPENFYWVYGGIARNLLFFLLGARLPDLLWRLGEGRGWTGLAASALIFAALSFTATSLDSAVVAIILEVSGIAVGILLATGAARHAWARRVGQTIGTRTLAIYVLHFPLLATLAALATPFLSRDLLANPLFAIAYPVAMTAATVALCLLMHRFLLAAGAAWLFTIPARLPALLAAPLALWPARRKTA